MILFAHEPLPPVKNPKMTGYLRLISLNFNLPFPYPKWELEKLAN